MLYSLLAGVLNSSASRLAVPTAVSNFVKKKKGKRAGKTLVAKSINPLYTDWIYLGGLRIRATIIATITNV